MSTSKNTIKAISIPGIILIFLSVLLSSCQKFLDAKPDKSLATPSTLADLQALLDNNILNVNYPVAGDIASDDYYLNYADWLALSTPDFRNDYSYDGSGANDIDYSAMYQYITTTNVVLDEIDKINTNGTALSDINAVKGAAYFFRGYDFFHLASVFALPYNSAPGLIGIPLKLTADITSPTTRGSLEETYQQILSDLKQAAALLPVQPTLKTRPSKPAAYGALARTYLAMRDYINAGLYADSCLQLYSTLIDYNTISTTSNTPFALFNNEVIFHATSSGRGNVVGLSKANIDTILYKSYATNDLRKKVFFKAGTTGNELFKGDYAAGTSSALFGGIATDEMYLIRAECYARNNNITNSLADLNTLLAARWQKGTYVPYTSSLTSQSLLMLILTERRKELLFRNEIRWNDIRRLNQESQFQKTLVRNLNGTVYSLAPDSRKYAYLFPVSVIQLTGIQQNAR